MTINIAAIDLGASSGRVMLAKYTEDAKLLKLKEIHRFPNNMIKKEGHDCWDIEAIYQNILFGLNQIDADGIKLNSIGIDSWGVDFVLLDKQGEMLGLPVAYRDSRTDNVPEQVMKKVSRAEIYQRTGIQFQKFNTLYQIQALINENHEWLPQVDKLLLIPDYLHYRLSGQTSCEYTNASTTQMLNAKNKDWDAEITAAIEQASHWLQPITPPGTVIGKWISPSGHAVPVIPPATHDTGSAIVATPLTSSHAAYISSGTWSLVGIESHYPVTSKEALAANLTNEGGVERTYRILKNVMGLWLLQGLQKELSNLSFADLTTLAEDAEPFQYLINPNDERFLNPASMQKEIQAFCLETRQGCPTLPSEIARCIFDSLALFYRVVIDELEEVSGRPIDTIHIVGGGSKNQLLNRLCADICQRDIVTGPIEASALGNITYQLKGLGVLADLKAIRSVIKHNFIGEHLTPNSIPQLETHWQRFLKLCSTKTQSQSAKTKEVA